MTTGIRLIQQNRATLDCQSQTPGNELGWKTRKTDYVSKIASKCLLYLTQSCATHTLPIKPIISDETELPRGRVGHTVNSKIIVTVPVKTVI